ncbi:hypothetical protein WJX75_007541 [Coccomyxa subellipsoidea]|uniref:Nuclear pore protein n=1 Tax=Coccomyxa subellipsoidea TaxID=248742 RepID=A0ABR2YUG0_9CHLO
MPPVSAPDWDQLLQQSEDLAARDSQGIPQIERDLLQVEQLSQKLKARTARIDSGSQTLAATRLLAQEGLNSRKLTRALQTFELRPTYEDVLPVESTSVEEYLEQMHELTTITAIQEAQRDTISAFEEYMDACMTADWAADKRALFDAALPDTAMPGPASQLAGGSLTSSVASAQFRSPLLPGGMPGTCSIGNGAGTLSGRMKSYYETVRSLNDATAARQPFQAIPSFAAAAAQDPDDGERRSTMRMLWDVLARIAAAAEARTGAGAARTQALLRGARKYLEEGHVTYLQNTIQANRAQASLGGAPSRQSQIQAFLRVREKDAGPLDFDSPGGADTTWHRIYLCLRSGFYKEAVEEAKGLRDAGLLRGGSFGAMLGEWVAAEGGLAPQSAQAMATEAERLLRSADRAAWQRSSFRHKAALYVLLSGDRRVAEHILREAPGLLQTIEDFMWFKLALVRPSRGETATSSGYFASGAGESWAYTLADLQAYLGQFPAAHYSHGGREPLLYCTVLLLSLQFRAAVAFLAQDASARDYRVDAPHLAIALTHHQLLDAGGDGDAGRAKGLDIAALVHRYGRSFVHSSPDVALEYYMQAAGIRGDTLEVKGQLLRELLTESNAFGYLMGSGGPGAEAGALERFVGNAQEKDALVAAVGRECERAAQMDWAVELYLYAGAPRAALALINQQLSNALQPALTDARKDEEVEQLIRRGADAAARLAAAMQPDDEAHKGTFHTLKLIRQLLTADKRGDHARVVQVLGQLEFVPQDQFRLQRCVDAAAMLAPVLAERLEAVLAAGGRALSATRQAGPLRVLAAFAGSLPQRVSQHTFRDLNRLQSAAA